MNMKQIKIFENRWLSIKNKNKMRQWLKKNSGLNDWSWSFIKSNFLNIIYFQKVEEKAL